METEDPLKSLLTQVLQKLLGGRQVEPIEGTMTFTLTKGLTIEVPMGQDVSEEDLMLASAVASADGCTCPGCSVGTRIALGLLGDIRGMSTDEARAYFNQHVSDSDYDRLLKEGNTWYRERMRDRESGGKPEYTTLQLTEGTKEENENMAATTTEQKQTIEFKNVQIVREGEKIILPKEMTFAQGRDWLTKQEKAEEAVVAINEDIHAFPLEGARAFAKALDQKFSFVARLSTPGWFKNYPPQMLDLEVGPNKTEQVLWGRVSVPAIDGYLQTAVGFEGPESKPFFRILGEVKGKHKELVHEVAELTRQIVRSESIYRGQAFRMEFPDDGVEWTPNNGPKFMDLNNVRIDELIFPESTQRLVDVAVLTPIRKTQMCRENHIPLKRGVLLEGPPGVGKTLTAGVVAKHCLDNGWTFIYLENVADLPKAIHFAKQYQPACIFAEDIDREVQGERDEDIDKVLNTLDGVDTKNSEIMVVVTTNYVEKITVEAIRPGRFDIVVPVRAPDAHAALSLVKLYARGLLASGTDLHKVGKALEGQIPAVIREIVERSKLAAIGRSEDGPLVITEQDILTTTDGMLSHLALLNRQPVNEKEKNRRENFEQLGQALGVAAAAGVKAHLEKPEHKPTNGSSKNVSATA